MGTTVWLERPQPPRDAERVARMRRAIEEDAPRQSLIADCLSAARASGLSGEDTYVFLAYHALLRLVETEQSHIYLSDIVPPRPTGPPSKLSIVQRQALDAARACAQLITRTVAACLAGPAYLTVRAPAYLRQLTRRAAATACDVGAWLRRASLHTQQMARAAFANWDMTWVVSSPRNPRPALAERRNVARGSAQQVRGTSRAA